MIMKTKFNFKSQICTTREQSERLIALGLKKETTDMTWFKRSMNADYESSTTSYREWVEEILPIVDDYTLKDIIPAWSFHRLIEIAGDDTGTIAIRYEGVTFNKDIFFYSHPTTYDNLIDCIEWLIKEGYFKKEYLENGTTENKKI